MFKVGLTGGIGSGKTTVARIFEVLGIPVYYADIEARKVMNEDPVLKEQIIRHFGERSYVEGKLDRAYIASRVFPDPAQLELLNSLVHPATILAGERWMEAQAGLAPYAIKEAALIFESRAIRYLDFVIGVEAPLPLRLQRTMQRDQTTRENVLKRMRYQIQDDIKMKLCDAVIRNDDQHALIPQVLELHEELVTRAASY
jgi:dephospho-CoA kinase